MSYLLIFLTTKTGTLRHQSRDQNVLKIFVRFESTFSIINWYVFVVFLNFYTVLPLSNYTSKAKQTQK